jgi:hypothetical protein
MVQVTISRFIGWVDTSERLSCVNVLWMVVVTSGREFGNTESEYYMLMLIPVL